MNNIQVDSFPVHKHDFARFYKQYYPILLKYGLKLVGNQELVMDAIQEIFLLLWQRRNELSHVYALNNYLLISFKRLLIRRFKNMRKESSVVKGLVTSGSYSESASSAEETLIEHEEKQAEQESMELFLNGLSPRRREAVRLRYMEGLTVEEISGYMDVKYQTVLNYFQKAFNQN